MKIGEIISTGIRGFGKKGNPFAKYKGTIIFIRDFFGKKMELGKTIKLQIKKICKNCVFAEIYQEKNKFLL